MASYKIFFKRSAEKELRKIDKSQIRVILSAIDNLAEDPFPPSSRKLVGSQHTYRLRVGDYRVVYLVDGELIEIQIQRIKHRKDVYR